MAVKIIDVAKRANVGCGTVSRVVNGDPHVSEKTRQKVNKVIQELGYLPNNLGKRLRTNKNNVVCVTVPVIGHSFFNVLIENLELELSKRGYNMLLIASQGNIEKERNILNKIRNKEVDGAIFVTHYSHPENEFKNLPIVSIDRHIRSDSPCVTSNNYEATKEAINYLISKGAKRIAYLGSKPTVDSEVSLRLKGYCDVVDDFGIERIIVNEQITHGDEQKLVDKLLNNHKDIDGVFVAGYSLCECLLATMKIRNINCPNDIQVVSYDGNFNKYDPNAPTTMSQPLADMAVCCADLINKLISGDTNIELKHIFKAKLIIGKTTK